MTNISIMSENDNSTVLAEYKGLNKIETSFQSEDALEKELIKTLVEQGYEKIEKIAQEVYGADGVDYTKAAKKAIDGFIALGADKLPVCMAKTQYSLSDDPTKLGRPSGFRITVSSASLSAGAGFLVCQTGNVMTMPGLSKSPAAYRIDVDDQGNTVGLF